MNVCKTESARRKNIQLTETTHAHITNTLAPAFELLSTPHQKRQ